MAAAQDLSPSVTIAPDKATASLLVPAGCDRAFLTEPLLMGQVSGAGVKVTDRARQAVRSFLDDPNQSGEDVILEVAAATPAVDGIDGSVVWCVDTGPENDGDGEDVSYYDRCAFELVQSGDIVGKVHAATPGQDGRDVTGAIIPAKPGREVSLQIDESLMKHADGSLIAQRDGVLHRDAHKTQIRNQIVIPDYVDFSTGNLDFDGDISIGRGVRDCFEVKASGNIAVKGLIEAATIDAGKDLIAAGGFAGREQGNVQTGGCLVGKYIDNVHGRVKRNLCIDREVINCELMIDGRICSPRGSIIGGRLTVTGEIEVGTLGSGACVVTELVIGSVPVLAPFADQLERIVERFAADTDKLQQEKDVIDKNSAKGRMTASDTARQTEIIFELSTINTSLDKARRTFESVCSEIAKRRRVDVTVNQIVHPGVMFVLDSRSYSLPEQVAGPVRFYMEGKAFVCRNGGAPAREVVQIADVHAVIPDPHTA